MGRREEEPSKKFTGGEGGGGRSNQVLKKFKGDEGSCYYF